jgi:hypothetical protein
MVPSLVGLPVPTVELPIVLLDATLFRMLVLPGVAAMLLCAWVLLARAAALLLAWVLLARAAALLLAWVLLARDCE